MLPRPRGCNVRCDGDEVGCRARSSISRLARAMKTRLRPRLTASLGHSLVLIATLRAFLLLDGYVCLLRQNSQGRQVIIEYDWHCEAGVKVDAVVVLKP